MQKDDVVLEGGTLEKATSHHVVELALKRIEAADDTRDFVVEVVLVSVDNV